MKPLGLIGRRHMWKSEGGFYKCTRTREKASVRDEIAEEAKVPAMGREYLDAYHMIFDWEDDWMFESSREGATHEQAPS